MKIAGLQKCTLLDYPGKVACTVFLPGCNFRCPFCHHFELVETPQTMMDDQELLAFLQKRQGLLEGVCITGGEPTLQPELPQLLQKIRELGFAVKLDTNGYRPDVLSNLLEQGLVDYVAMDVKNGPGSYATTCGLEHLDLAKIEDSIRLLLENKVDYELRTTLVEPLHTEQSVLQMGQWLASLVPGKKPKQLFLQRFVDRDTVVFSGLCAPGEDTVSRYGELLTPYVEKITLRGG